MQDMVPGEADGPVRLVGGGADAAAGPAGPRLGDGDLPGGGQAPAEAPGGLVGGGPGALAIDEHIGAAVLDGLERPDRVPEGRPLSGVIKRYLEDLAGDADHLGAAGDRRPP